MANIDTSMQTTFLEWLVSRDLGFCLRVLRQLLEQNQSLDKNAYNQLFDRQLTDLLRRVDKPGERSHLEPMLNFDWTGDIERALRKFGFHNETDELSHDIVVRLLVSPGRLFVGWQGQPMLARFRASVKNAIANVIEKRANRRRLIPTVSIQPGYDPGAAYLGEPPSLIDEFLDYLRSRYGELPARVFQHRLAGGETRELFGKAGSRHEIKQAVNDVKAAARDFAAQSGDPAFVGAVERAMFREKETVGKRRASIGKR